MFNALMLCLVVAVQSPYPLDQELKSSFSGSCDIEMNCKVTKTADVYTYMYSIKNKGTKPIKVKWDITSKAVHLGNVIDLLVDLEPNENIVFTLQHPDPPATTGGRVTIFYLTTDRDVEKLVRGIPEVPKELRIKISKKSIYSSESGIGNGALPQSWVHPKRN